LAATPPSPAPFNSARSQGIQRPGAMADPAIAKYLSDNIGGLLSKGLSEMAIAQPSDGVDFLAQWLKVHIEQEEAKGKRAEEEAELLEARKKTTAKLEEQAAKKAAREKAAAEREAVWQNALAKFNTPDTTFEPGFWQELLVAASTLTSAKSAYLGLVEEEGLAEDGDLPAMEGPLIRYVEALPGSEAMKGRVLRRDQGVTWGAVTENPTEEVPFLYRPPQPEVAEPNPDDPDAAPEEPPPAIPYLPVAVPCVTDVPEVHYFEVTRLGAFLAVPLVYNSYYTEEARQEAKKFELEKKETEEKRKEAQEQYDAAVQEAMDSGGQEAADAIEKPPELEPQEEKVMVLPGKVVRMVLCLDTLGTNEPIDASKYETAMELSSAIGKCKEATEVQLVDAQARAEIDDAAREKLKEEIAEVRGRAAEQFVQEQQEEEEDATDDARKDEIAKKYAYQRAFTVLKELREAVFELKKWVVAPPEMLNLVATLCRMYGYTSKDLFPPRKDKLDWQVLLEVLSQHLFERIEETDPTGPRTGLEPEQKLSAIKEKMTEFGTEKIQELSPALELLLTMLEAAVAYRESHLQLRKAEYEAEKAEAANAEEPMDPPEPPEDDEDLVEILVA